MWVRLEKKSTTTRHTSQAPTAQEKSPQPKPWAIIPGEPSS